MLFNSSFLAAKHITNKSCISTWNLFYLWNLFRIIIVITCLCYQMDVLLTNFKLVWLCKSLRVRSSRRSRLSTILSSYHASLSVLGFMVTNENVADLQEMLHKREPRPLTFNVLAEPCNMSTNKDIEHIGY